jgi:hypothetical protein
LLGLKNKAQLSEGIEMTNHSLKSELDLNLEEIIRIPSKDFITKLLSKGKLTGENLENLQI